MPKNQPVKRASLTRRVALDHANQKLLAAARRAGFCPEAIIVKSLQTALGITFPRHTGTGRPPAGSPVASRPAAI